MYHGAAKKRWAIFFWFYPLKELFFYGRGSLAVQISREAVLPAQNRLSGKVLHSISDGLSIDYDHLSGCPDFQRGGSAGRGTTSLEKCCTAFLMGWALIMMFGHDNFGWKRMVSESEIQTGKITEVVLLALMMTNWQLQLYNVCNENVQCAMEMCNIKKQFSILFSILHPIPSQWVKPSPLNLFNCSRPPKPNLFSPPLQEFNFSDMYQGGGGVPLTEHWAALLQNIRFGQVEEPMTLLARRLLFWWSSNETLWGVRDLTGLKSCENKWHGIVLVMYFDVHVQ